MGQMGQTPPSALSHEMDMNFVTIKMSKLSMFSSGKTLHTPSPLQSGRRPSESTDPSTDKTYFQELVAAMTLNVEVVDET